MLIAHCISSFWFQEARSSNPFIPMLPGVLLAFSLAIFLFVTKTLEALGEIYARDTAMEIECALINQKHKRKSKFRRDHSPSKQSGENLISFAIWMHLWVLVTMSSMTLGFQFR